MKKIMILAAAMLLLSVTSARADHDRPIQFNQLPVAAQEFVNTYFSDQKVSFAKEERDFMEVRYEVMFTNSIKIEFYKDGQWKEVNCKYSVLQGRPVEGGKLQVFRTSRRHSSRADHDVRQQQLPRSAGTFHRP